jgi:hypothetical protein
MNEAVQILGSHDNIVFQRQIARYVQAEECPSVI